MKVGILIPLLVQDWQPYVSFGLKIKLQHLSTCTM